MDSPAASRFQDSGKAHPEQPTSYRLREVGPGFRLLIVGDGDLSWSLATARLLPAGVTFVATTLDTRQDLSRRYSAARIEPTLEELGSLEGVELRFGVDATKLKPHEFFGGQPVDRIVFNFPHHGGQGHIERNRQLLFNFFAAAAPLLAPDGECVVALVAGQGGTLADKDLGAEGNTWRVVEQAHAAGLVLAMVRPFTPPPGYTCSGRRGREAGFWIGGALDHVFVRAGRCDGTPSLFPPMFFFDVSFWVLDEAAFDPAALQAAFTAPDDCGCLVSFEPASTEAIYAVPYLYPEVLQRLGWMHLASEESIRHRGDGGHGHGGDNFTQNKTGDEGPESGQLRGLGIQTLSLASTEMAAMRATVVKGGTAVTSSAFELRSLVWRATYRAPMPMALGKQAALELHERCKEALRAHCGAVIFVRGHKACPAAVR